MIHLANFVRLLFSVYIILIFVRVLFAWVRPNMFNPLVRFVYTLTNPYLKLFAGLRFLRIGAFDLTPLLAFYLLYLLMELSHKVLLTGYFSWMLLLSLVLVLLFRFVYFLLFVFIVATGLRFVFDLAGRRVSSALVSIVYSLSEPVVKPFQSLLRRSEGARGFDLAVVLSLAVLVLARFLVLPRVYGFLVALLGKQGSMTTLLG
jgi:YggT family protein